MTATLNRSTSFVHVSAALVAALCTRAVLPPDARRRRRRRAPATKTRRRARRRSGRPWNRPAADAEAARETRRRGAQRDRRLRSDRPALSDQRLCRQRAVQRRRIWPTRCIRSSARRAIATTALRLYPPRRHRISGELADRESESAVARSTRRRGSDGVSAGAAAVAPLRHRRQRPPQPRVRPQRPAAAASGRAQLTSIDRVVLPRYGARHA